jgi:hypothetical protein
MTDKLSDKTELSQDSATRRIFLKKAVYTAPALITLGLVIPKKGAAGFGDPPSGPLNNRTTPQGQQRKKPRKG